MAPVLSDISIEWLYPETKEVLLSPAGTSYLFPGDRLIGYSVVCDTTRYHPNPKSVSTLQQSIFYIILQHQQTEKDKHAAFTIIKVVSWL